MRELESAAGSEKFPQNVDEFFAFPPQVKRAAGESPLLHQQPDWPEDQPEKHFFRNILPDLAGALRFAEVLPELFPVSVHHLQQELGELRIFHEKLFGEEHLRQRRLCRNLSETVPDEPGHRFEAGQFRREFRNSPVELPDQGTDDLRFVPEVPVDRRFGDVQLLRQIPDCEILHSPIGKKFQRCR